MMNWKQEELYDFGRRDTNKETHEGGADIKYGRFLDELQWEFVEKSDAIRI